MDREGIFFRSLIVMIIFEIGYYLVNINAIWMLGLGAITSLILIGLIVGIVAGISALTVGLSDTSVRIAFIASTIISLFMQVEIPLSWFGTIGDAVKPFTGGDVLPLGIGLLYPNITSVFITANTDILSIFGLIIVSVIMLITVVSGILIAVG
jgi:hypothetical protein